jgi:hypothetical protein
MAGYPRALKWLPGAAVLAACGGGVTAPSDDRAPFDFSFVDPAGDTLLPAPSDPPGTIPRVDLIGVDGSVESNRIRLVLTFGAPVAPWSRAAPNSVDGFVDFDLDESPSTGTPAAAREAMLADPAIGAEFYLDLRDARSGRMALVNTRTRVFRLVSARFDDATVTIDIPRDALDPDDGEFLLSIVVGNRAHPVTDVAPNDLHYAVHAPGSP